MTMTNQTLVPHLWYDKEAKEAAAFYTSIFPNSGIMYETTLQDTPSGDCDLISFELWGRKFMAISAGPFFKFNPSLSFMVHFDSSREKDAGEKLNEMWSRLSEGGTVLMPLDTYPFSDRYGWIQDKYGLSWQLMLTNPEREEWPPLVPSLMFTGDKYGRAEAAIHFYLSAFKHSELGQMVRYPKEVEPDNKGAVMYSDFMLENQWFAAMDSAGEHQFRFNEAVSFMVYCDNQEEINYYWEKLSAVPESEQCGWLKDKYGLSWQIVPKQMDEMMSCGTPEQIGRVNQAVLKMKKLDLAELQAVYEEN
ncbi:VOC family protein [Halobacillus salinarum]|uniref:VOC family protein n=1 Tax=Halobacillus salinarum TaxID=2932257 RepID=A0ABY4EMI7_9BACI|nr:VOC family protein [Halobacillus salinarum]UOQ45600.1 VOC family protein [Halobacillus salinarum]